jgi:phenylalanyl-tRNA synthetase beta chain
VGGIVDGGFFAAKSAVELVYDVVGVAPKLERGEGRSASTGEGVLAELDGGLGYFELDLDALVERAPVVRLYEDVITFPGVKQDLAFVVDEHVLAGELEQAARAAAGAELREFRPFDVYRGDQVGAGRKSIAFAAVFQSPERTLADEDAAEIRGRIVAALAERFGAELR